jgi:hypothetical protein
MVVYGLDVLQRMLESDDYFLKLVANESAVFFFPHTTEHRDAKQVGLSYEDNSAGNALAATVKLGQIDFRFHRAFSDERVRNLARGILEHPDISSVAGFAVRYQGRPL